MSELRGRAVNTPLHTFNSIVIKLFQIFPSPDIGISVHYIFLSQYLLQTATSCGMIDLQNTRRIPAMANHELLPTQNLNCEVTTSDVSFDFGDTSRFRKIEFPEQAGLTANSLLQLLPAAAASDAASKTYILKFPEGVQGTLLHLRRGGYTTTIVDSTSHFSGTASLHPVDPVSVSLFNVFSLSLIHISEPTRRS